MKPEKPHDDLRDSYAIAAAMAARWLSAYCAREPRAEAMLQALLAEPRALARAFGALGELFLNTLTKLDADGVIEGGVQVWLDRLALNTGAAADAVVARYRADEGEK